jgi:hypothetical protein
VELLIDGFFNLFKFIHYFFFVAKSRLLINVGPGFESDYPHFFYSRVQPTLMADPEIEPLVISIEYATL